MKKLFAILLSVLLLCATIPFAAVSADKATSGTTGNCTWKLEGNHLTISGNGKMGNYYYYWECPWYSWKNTITAITVEDGVTGIGNQAFEGCKALTEVNLSNTVAIIGGDAFSDCAALTTVTIPNGVTTIGDWAFSVCKSLTSVTLSDSVVSIGTGAFHQCTALPTITIPDSVTSLGYSAFSWCYNLSSVFLGKGVATIDFEVFEDCYSLLQIDVDKNNPHFSSDNGVLFNKDKTSLLQYPESKGRTYAIPDGVTTIGFGAFGSCQTLTAVTIPSSVTTIKDAAFARCYSLSDIYYNGDPEDRAAINIGVSNSYLSKATWHYTKVSCDHLYDNDFDAECNECGAERDITHPIHYLGMSASEEVRGLAVQFCVAATGFAVKGGTFMQADYTNATYNGYKLIAFGVTASNSVVETTINGERMYELNEDGSASFAFRIINIPNGNENVTVFFTPYYVIEIDGEQVTLYGETVSGTYAAFVD